MDAERLLVTHQCGDCGATWSGERPACHAPALTETADLRLDVDRLHAAIARTEKEVTRQGIVLGRDADVSDYADAIAIAYAALAAIERIRRDDQ